MTPSKDELFFPSDEGQGRLRLWMILRRGFGKRSKSTPCQVMGAQGLEEVPCRGRQANEEIHLRLPDEIVEFCGLLNNEVGLSASRNEALLTVEAMIISVTE